MVQPQLKIKCTLIDLMYMTSGRQPHSANFVTGNFCDEILDVEEPEKIEMVLLTRHG